METSATVSAVDLEGLGALYESLAKAYALGGLEAVMRDHGLVVATAVVAVVVLFLLLVVIFMPSRRKVVVKRKVRVTRQAVASKAARPMAEDTVQRASEDAPCPGLSSHAGSGGVCRSCGA